jgi:hypothetical protein
LKLYDGEYVVLVPNSSHFPKPNPKFIHKIRRRRNPKKDKREEDEWLSESMEEEQTLPLGGRAVETRRRRR